MRVHLIRSNELELETFQNVLNLLKQFTGPIEFCSVEEEISSVETFEMEWQDEKTFNKKSKPRFKANLSYFSNEESYSFPIIERQATCEDLFKKCREYRLIHQIPNQDSVFLLTNISNELNWFGAPDESLMNFFIQTSHWSYFFGSEIDNRFPVSYEVLIWLLRIKMFSNQQEIYLAAHHEPIGCIMDFCKEKSQVVLKMRTADICQDCLKIIQDKDIHRPILNQLIDGMEGIRKHILFRERSEFLSQPSRIEIRGFTSRIFLTDLGELEVNLNPKEKTLFIFYLNHPEGVRLVDLIDYRQEILQLYKRYSNSSDGRQIEESIRILLDPTEQNINQVLSRIRKKFKKLVGDVLFEKYAIQGIRGEHYAITLDRELVKVLD